MSEQVENFLRRWEAKDGGQERANYSMFLTELCDLLQVSHPDVASHATEFNDYVFERVVKEAGRDGVISRRRIDLYKRDCFVLEAKQSRFDGEKRLSDKTPELPGLEPRQQGRRGASRGWDALMINARRQAEDYVRLLPVDHEPPPFILACDVGHCIEVYANFRRDGKAFDIFPDRRGYRIYLEDLRKQEVRDRLRAIWTDPFSLDPSKHAAKVTRRIAARIAKVSKALEEIGHSTQDVAMFLIRVLFTMFAEDVGLLPKDSFKRLLKDCVDKPAIYPGMMEDLWRAMDEGSFSAAIGSRVRRFNGDFFKQRQALKLGRGEIEELAAAATYDWRDVEPAVFGTFLEQALDPEDRRKLGAHYTPRAYVERLVIATVIDPLRREWESAQTTADRQKREGKGQTAITTVRAFHDKLCKIRVLDPACGTGNFLYVALELMKKLESQVLEALADLGGQEALTGLQGHTVDPHQFLGLEVNPRAAAIAELVLWIGHLQLHFRNNGSPPREPILEAFHNIKCMDAVLKWDGYPMPKVVGGKEVYLNPQRPEWPEADYIVGNPPFVGGKDIRARMGSGYAEALWQAHKHMNESADFVMYWWDRSAEILRKPKSRLKRFGFVTTNSISQVFQRRVIERHLNDKRPLSIVMAIPDHPWTKVTRDSAAVRIAMTVAEAGTKDGRLMEVTSEEGVDTDSPVVIFEDKEGRINSDLTVGVDVTSATEMKANKGLGHDGVKLHGKGFVLSAVQAQQFGLGSQESVERIIRPYRNGMDLAQYTKNRFVIDAFGLSNDDLRLSFPSIYQHLLSTVRIEREAQFQRSPTKDAKAYLDLWWLFGKPRQEMRPAILSLANFIATVDTAKHRVFQFIESNVVCVDKIVIIASDNPFLLGVLSSRIHTLWSLRAGGWLGVGNDSVYTKTLTFDPFPFPAPTEAQKVLIGSIAEELDAHRKRVLADHEHLTLTGLYNVLERLRAGIKPADLNPKERRIFDDGLVLILKELHDRLDIAVADAYGWPADLPEEEVLTRLVALNKERAKEEARGLVRWLRPEYQIPRFGSPKEKTEQLEVDLGIPSEAPGKAAKAAFPSTDDIGQTGLVIQTLIDADQSLDAAAIAARFKQGQKIRPAVTSVLTSLYRMGLVSSSDMGKTFSYRRAA